MENEITIENTFGTFHKGIVNIDGGQIIPNTPALIASYDWNGWAVPFFSKDDAQKIIDQYHTKPEDARQTRFEWKGVHLQEIYPEDGEIYTVGEIISDGQAFYGIGAESWTWEEADGQ